MLHHPCKPFVGAGLPETRELREAADQKADVTAREDSQLMHVCVCGCLRFGHSAHAQANISMHPACVACGMASAYRNAMSQCDLERPRGHKA